MMSPSLADRAPPSPPEAAGPRRPDAPQDAAAIFPLALTPFEQLFLLDETPAYPTQFFCRLRFRGRLRQPILQQAARLALARHPMLTAVIGESAGGALHWWPASATAPQIEWNEREPGDAMPPASALDIRRQPGVKMTAVIGTYASDLVVQFHHSACDGVGASDFITDLLTAYANVLAGAEKFRFKPLDVARLRRRGAAPLAGRRLAVWALRQARRLWTVWKFFRRRPAPVLPHRPRLDDPAPPPAFPEACVHHFSREESAVLASFAHGSESSLNALLVRDLFLSLHAWRLRQGLVDNAWLRLMLPINLRTPGDRRMPAANVVSTIFVDRCMSGNLDGAAILNDVARLMQDVKQHDLGVAWLLAMPLLQRLPRSWAKARHSRRRCQYSALLTNLGPVLAASPLPRRDRNLVVGDLTLEAVEFLPVARPLQCVGVGVSTYAGRMSLAMRYDSRALTQEQAKDLLNELVQRLHRSMQMPAVARLSGAGVKAAA